MASFEPIDFDPLAPPPRPTTPPVRRGFLVLLAGLSLAALAVYGIPYAAYRTGYAYEAGRSRAASESLAKLDDAGIIKKASLLFRQASTAVAPAVVNVTSWKAIPAGPGHPGGLARVGSGSGVVMNKAKGFVITNNHVIQGADRIGVRLGRGEEATARKVGVDPKTDLAVLQVNISLPVEARWGDSDKLDIGDWVLAIGSPFDLDRTVTEGIVSATGRNNLRVLGEATYQDFIQTDAPINPGNSGGPLINLAGEVVGINTAILSGREGGEEMGGNVGIGFAISSTLARKVVDQLIQSGRVARGYLGVIIDDLGGERARQLKIPSADGALVVEVQPGGPADLAGLKSGDAIVALGGKPVVDRTALRSLTASLPIGVKAPLKYFRNGKAATTEVTIVEIPVLMDLGLRLREIGAEEAKTLPGSPPTALIVDQILSRAVAKSGLIPGLQVVAVGEVPVNTLAEVNAAAAAIDPGQGIPLHVRSRDGQNEATVLLGGQPTPRGR